MARHKWEKEINHPYCHRFFCKKCGCLKDATAMMNIFYEIDGNRTAIAPLCDQRLVKLKVS